jgi:tetratricopeptide (TPR) repeat protein
MSEPNLESEGPPPRERLQAILRSPLRLLDWMGENRTNMFTVASAALLGIVVLVGVFVYKQRELQQWQARQPKPVTLEMAFESLDTGNFAEARSRALKVRADLKYADQKPACLYILGAAAARQADDTWGDDRRGLYKLAVKYLREAEELGIPAARQSSALWLLGRSLAFSGQYEECRPVLEEALEAGAAEATQIHQLLAGAYRRGAEPDLERSLGHLSKYLKDPSLDANDRHAAKLLRAQILWQRGDAQECRKELDGIPPRTTVSSEATLLRGRILLRDARQSKLALGENATSEEKQLVSRNYIAAIDMLRRAQEDPLGSRAIRKAMYLIGIAYLDQRDIPAALAQFERTRKLYLDTAEGMAAALQEADLLRKLNRDDDAVAAYRRVLASRKSERRFDNPWIPLDKFRARVVAAYRSYLAKADYTRASSIAERMSPLFSKGRALELVGEAYRDEGRRLLSRSDQQSESQSNALADQGRERMRTAGGLFRRQARLNFTTREYPEQVWRAAECFWIGQQYTGAIEAYEEFMKYELRRQRATALVRLGDCYLSLGKIDGSISSLRECIELFPEDAAAYEARFLASCAYREKGDFAAAEQLLNDNLVGDLLTPESKEWRNSLFELGDLLVSLARYQEAIERLEEAVSRYPEGDQTVTAHYLLARSYRKLAEDPQQKLESATVSTARAALRKEIQTVLEAAVEHTRRVQELLGKRQEQRELTPLEKATLRNSYFAQGASLFDLQRYDDAIKAYSTATNQYQHEPEVLEGFMQIASCYRRLGRLGEARGIMQQAKVVLQRLDESAAFSVATNQDRRQWTELLDWWAKFYQAK